MVDPQSVISELSVQLGCAFGHLHVHLALGTHAICPLDPLVQLGHRLFAYQYIVILGLVLIYWVPQWVPPYHIFHGENSVRIHPGDSHRLSAMLRQ